VLIQVTFKVMVQYHKENVAKVADMTLSEGFLYIDGLQVLLASSSVVLNSTMSSVGDG